MAKKVVTTGKWSQGSYTIVPATLCVSRGWLTDARSIPMSIANIFCTTLSSMKIVTLLCGCISSAVGRIVE